MLDIYFIFICDLVMDKCIFFVKNLGDRRWNIDNAVFCSEI
jgi:hypothetical protein